MGQLTICLIISPISMYCEILKLAFSSSVIRNNRHWKYVSTILDFIRSKMVRPNMNHHIAAAARSLLTLSHIIHACGFWTDSVQLSVRKKAFIIISLKKQQLATTTWKIKKKNNNNSFLVSFALSDTHWWCGVLWTLRYDGCFYWEQRLCLLNWVGNTENRPTHSVCAHNTVMVNAIDDFSYIHTEVRNWTSLTLCV